MPHRAALVLVLAVLFAAPAAAQVPQPGPPGPYVFDVRGALGGFPRDTAFFPPVPTGTVVPTRGFGIDLGAHVYLLRLGAARLGLGASVLRAHHKTSPAEPTVAGTSTPPPARTVPDVDATLTMLVPQLSFNFGTADGWSYVSAGYGRAEVNTATSGIAPAATKESGPLSSINMGGGARWFRSPHLAVGFDVRFHILSARTQEAPLLGTPRSMVITASAGISLR
jgi:hypothetical protein